LGVFVLALMLISLVLCSVRLALGTIGLGAAQRNYLILGGGPIAALVASELESRKDLQVNVIGCVLPPTALEDEDYAGNVIGNSDQLRHLVLGRNVGTIVVALEDRRGMLPMADLVRLRVEGVEIQDAHAILAALRGRVCLDTVRPSWFVYSEGFHRSRLRLALKTMFDVLFAASILVLTAPILLLTALAVRLDSDGPVLYRQKRVGMRGQPFYLLKLRSMRIDAEANGAQWASEDDPRVTRVGRWIRKFRLDELPQLFNVLRAEMSLVGPRPERPEFVDVLRQSIVYYDERHSVRPGITGWAQVRYNYGSTTEDARRKLEYDLFYLKNMSVMFDLAIVLDTVRIVLTGRGGR
jgi:sugar transferase (PEP-CTERM system associated)